MSLRLVSAEERPELAGQREPLLAGWPEFVFHDPVAGACWDNLYERFPALTEAATGLELGPPVRSVFDEARQLRDGRWLFVPVESERDIEYIQRLLSVKRRPRRPAAV